MAQNLPAPCYQVYAASVLASLPFRKADLATRGLISTMQMECWVNQRLPSNPADLAKVLGFDVSEVAGSLAAAMAFFDTDKDGIFSPQLEDYRTHLDEIRVKQKAGGKIGAAKTNGKKASTETPVNTEIEGVSTNSHVHSQVEARVSSKAKSNTEKQSQNQPIERGVIPTANSVSNDEWVAGYEAVESCSANEYAKATRG